MTKPGKTILYLATVALIILVILSFRVSLQEKTPPFFLSISTDGQTEQIQLWQQGDEYYGFLPAWAELDQIQFQKNTNNPVTLNGTLLEDGVNCADFPMNQPLTLTYTSWGAICSSTVTFMQSANIAAMHIDTQSGSMEFIHKKKGNEESGTLRLYTADGTMNHAGNLLSIGGRGNTTWKNAEKKPYGLTLEKTADLLDMGSAQKWILLANGFDSSNMRNKLVYEFAREVGLAYSPDTRWVDLYLNGEYFGLYLLCERNEVHPQRVNISGENSMLVSLEMESRLIQQNYPHIRTAGGHALRIRYPSELSLHKTEELLALWQSLENAIMAGDDMDPVTGKTWMDMIDLDSWVRKYLTEEIFGNIDAGMISQFFYQDGSDPSGKIFAGPIWDFDYALGNRRQWGLLVPETLHANQLRQKEGVEKPWFYCLYQKEVFYNRVTELYINEFLPKLERLDDMIGLYMVWIEDSSEMNRIRWGLGELREEAEYLAVYMDRRVDFLTGIWRDNAEYCYIYADYGNDCCYTVKPGECFQELYIFPELNTDYFLGWYNKETDEPFDPEQPITEDIYVYTKWQPKHRNPLENIIKLIPLGIAGLFGVLLLAADIRRNGKQERKNGTKVSS